MNKSLVIQLNSIKRVKDFVHIAESFDSDIDAIQGRYRVAATSVMGIFSLSLIDPIKIMILSEDKDEINRFNEVFKLYVIEED